MVDAINPAIRLINRAGQVLLAVLGGALLLHGRMSVGVFQAFFQYVGQAAEPLTEIAGSAVVKVTDYEKPEETGLPSANVLIYKLANGETVIVRPSGTEPKIKVYYTTLGKDLAEAEAEKEKLAEALKPILA